ncbi:MAG: ATP-grasp fold amidoligase family protein [Clostridia bacterium]|nr:ATP-grasp fold amidoligase family protein [Clostridia bacterium]
MIDINLIFLLYRKPFRFILPDALHIKLMYKYRMGRKLNLKNPESFTEKIQWLKLHDRNPMYHKLADKIAAREYIREKIGEEYLVPLIATYDSTNEIEYDELPDQFVLKCNHDSKSKYICRKKDRKEFDEAIKFLGKRLKANYYYYFREWAYKKIKPRITCEEYLEDTETGELRDYRFYCFNGKVELIAVDYDIIKAYKRAMFTPDWQFHDVRYKHLKGRKEDIEKPEQLSKMIELAQTLSEGMIFLRVGLFIANNVIYAGELTFYPSAGYSQLEPMEFDYYMGKFMELPI